MAAGSRRRGSGTRPACCGSRSGRGFGGRSDGPGARSGGVLNLALAPPPRAGGHLAGEPPGACRAGLLGGAGAGPGGNGAAMNKTSISWTDFSSNPLYVLDKETGKRGWFCEKVSPGCAHCYASALNIRRGTGHAYLPANREKVEWRLNEGELEAIEQRRKPTRIFMCDMTDLFHEDVPDAFIDRILYTMETAPHHTFQVLTKRPARMRRALRRYRAARCMTPSMMPNVHLGVSVENQRLADERIPVLLDTPATVRFLSCEPLLGPLDLTPWLRCQACGYSKADRAHWGDHRLCPAPGATIDWVIVGGESGPGSAERKLVERC